jgi:hypothetical protein
MLLGIHDEGVQNLDLRSRGEQIAFKGRSVSLSKGQ